MQEAIRIAIDTLDRCFNSLQVDSLRAFLSQDTKYVLISDYSVGDKPSITFSFSVVPFREFKKVDAEILGLVLTDLKKTKKTEPMNRILSSSYVFNFCIVSTKKTFFQSILGHDAVRRAFENQMAELGALQTNDLSDLIGMRKRMQRAVALLGQRSANYSLVKKLVFTAAFSAFFACKISGLSKVSEVFWISDRDKMTTFAEGVIFDLFRINCLTMPFGDRSTRFTYNNEAHHPAVDRILRIPDYTAGALADYDFQNETFSMPKHENIVRTLIDGKNSFLFKLDHRDAILSVGRVSYVTGRNPS